MSDSPFGVRVMIQLSRPGGIARPKFFTRLGVLVVAASLLVLSFVAGGVYGYFTAPFSGIFGNSLGPQGGGMTIWAPRAGNQDATAGNPAAARREFETDAEYQRVFGWLTDIGNNPDEYRARLAGKFRLDEANKKTLSSLFRFWKPSLLEVVKLQKQMKKEGRDAVNFLEVWRAVRVAFVQMQYVCLYLAGTMCEWGVMPHDKQFSPHPAPKTPALKKEWVFSAPAVFFLFLHNTSL